MNSLKKFVPIIISFLIFFVSFETGLQLFPSLYRFFYTEAGSNDSGKYFILVLGESTSTGLATEKHRSWPIQLLEMLNVTGQYEVLNFSEPGITTTSLLKKTHELLKTKRPDMVISMMGTNDHPHFWYRDFDLIKTGQAKFELKSLKLLKILLHYKKFLPTSQNNAFPNKPQRPQLSTLDHPAPAELVKRVQLTPLKSKSFQKILHEVESYLKNKSDIEKARFYAYIGHYTLAPWDFTDLELDRRAYEFLRRAISINATVERALENALLISLRTGQNSNCKLLMQHVLDQKATISEVSYGRLVNCMKDDVEFVNSYLADSKAPYRFEARNDSPTAANYKALSNLLRERDICWIAMTYPRQDFPESISQFEDSDLKDVQIFPLQNKGIFEDALKTASYEDLFIDKFAHSFGHLSVRGAKLIAENAFNKIQEIKSKKLCGL